MFIRIVDKLVKLIKTCCNSFRNSEASEQDMQEYFAKCEIERQLEQQESERNLQEYLAEGKAQEEKLEREHLEYELECEKRLEDQEFNRAEDERERRECEMEAEQAEQEHYRSHCPTCGSRWSTWNSRCRVCDEAFGH